MSSELPKDWPVVAIGSLTRVKRGASPRPIQDPKWFSDEGHGWVRISDVTASDRVLLRTTQYLSEAGREASVEIVPGDLIMSICGTIGRPLFSGIHACIHDGFVAFKEIDTSRLDPTYLYFVLQAQTRHFEAQSQPGTQRNLNSALVGKTEIPLPPLDEQRRIAEVLRSVDEAIAAADATQEAAQQVFIHVRAELVEGARQCFDEIVVANAISKNRGEKLIKLQTSDYQDAGAFPIIDQGASFICGYTDDHSALWPYALPVIVFGDHTRILKFVDFPFAIGADGTQCLTPIADLDARFFYFALQSLDLRGEGYARHFKLLKGKTIPLPDMPAQLEIANQLSALEQSMAAAETARQRLQQTKRALMSDLLSGRVRVPA